MGPDEPDSFSRHSSRSSSDSAGPQPLPLALESGTVRRLPPNVAAALKQAVESTDLDWGDDADFPAGNVPSRVPVNLPSSHAAVTAGQGVKRPSGGMKTFALTDANLALHAQTQQAQAGRFFQPALTVKHRTPAAAVQLDDLDDLDWGDGDVAAPEKAQEPEEEDEKQRTLTLTKGQARMFAKPRVEQMDGMAGLRGVTSPRSRPGADALDSMDDLQDDDEGADTLKADPAAFRQAMLAHRPPSAALPAASGTGGHRLAKQTTPPTQDEAEGDFLADLEIPAELDLTALTLEEKKRSRRSGPRHSAASGTSSGGVGTGSPAHSTSSRAGAAAGSPRSMTSGRSAQSLTSAISSVMTPSGPGFGFGSGSDGFAGVGQGSPVRALGGLGGLGRLGALGRVELGAGEEEDMEDGLELGKAFFSTGAGALRDLEKKLDKRRRPGNTDGSGDYTYDHGRGSVPNRPVGQRSESRAGGEMEDGLVFDDEADLSRRQLSKSRHLRQAARGLPVRPALPPGFGEPGPGLGSETQMQLRTRVRSAQTQTQTQTQTQMQTQTQTQTQTAGREGAADLGRWRERELSGAEIRRAEKERPDLDSGRGSLRSQSAAVMSMGLGMGTPGGGGRGTVGRGAGVREMSRLPEDVFSRLEPGAISSRTRERGASGENRRTRSDDPTPSGNDQTHGHMPPPATPAGPPSVSRLRHQKSHFILPTTGASGSTPGRLGMGMGTIRRKQSLDILPVLSGGTGSGGGRERGGGVGTATFGSRLHAIADSPVRLSAGSGASAGGGGGSGFTLPTLSSLSKSRPALQGVFGVPLPGLPSRGGTSGSAAKGRPSMAQKLMGLPRRGGGKGKVWGDGTELDGLDDLDWGAGAGAEEGKGSVGRKKGSDLSVRSRSGDQGSVGSGGKGRAREKSGGSHLSARGSPGAADKEKEKEREKSKGSGSGSLGRKKGVRGQPSLIRNMGGVDKPKLVQGMMWDPVNLRWEGNESALAAFEGLAPARPALITPYAVGHTLAAAAAATPHATPSSSALRNVHTSPDLTSLGGLGRRQITPHAMARIEGNMRFDPERMCWLSVDPGEEEDPFDDLSDDEFGATLTKAQGAKLVAVGLSAHAHGLSNGNGEAGRFVSLSTASTYTSISASSALSGVSGTSGTSGLSRASHVSRGSEASSAPYGAGPEPVPGVGYVTAALIAASREAEERHRREMKGWVWGVAGRPGAGGRVGEEEVRERERRERRRLWEVRKVARSS